MKFAFVENKKIAPIPKTKGKCIACGNEVISKCGSKNIWHWSHSSKKHCDHWWENEGPWHREWKEHFPESSQEISLRDNKTGELHIADILTKNGLVIELQNSTISYEETVSRESFYKNMVWIVNAEKFRKNIVIGHALPSAESNFSKNIIFQNRTEYGHIILKNAMWRLKNESNPNESMSLIHGGQSESDVIEKVIKFYDGDHFFHWKNRRTVWTQSNVSVFLDFGTEDIWHLNLNHPNSPRSLVMKRFSKSKLIIFLTKFKPPLLKNTIAKT